MLEDASDSGGVGFDAGARAGASDPDAEARGLRGERAVLAVVVATTGAAAGGAQAMPTLGGQSGVSGGAAVTPAHDTPADGAVAAYAARTAPTAPSEGAPASRANPSDAAAATIAQEARLAQQARFDSYREVLPSGHHMAPTVATEPARDVPSDSVRASQTPPVARVDAGTEAGSVDSTTFVIVGGIALALLGAAFGATAATRKTPRPT